jgi:hypothetical protein
LPRGEASHELARLDVGAEARAAIWSAIAARPHGEAVLVFYEEREAEVVDRAVLIGRYARAGVRELVSKLRRAAVPADKVLCLADLERGTHVFTLPRSALEPSPLERLVAPVASWRVH